MYFALGDAKMIGANPTKVTKGSVFFRAIKAIRRDRWLFAIMLLPTVYYLLFCYYPMYGILIAFKNYPQVSIGYTSQLQISYYQSSPRSTVRRII